MTEVIESRSEKDTFALGQKLGGDCRPGDIVLLNGDLGVGKTVFTKGFGKGLGIEEPISSPTFTIMQIYEMYTGLQIRRRWMRSVMRIISLERVCV